MTITRLFQGIIISFSALLFAIAAFFFASLNHASTIIKSSHQVSKVSNQDSSQWPSSAYFPVLCYHQIVKNKSELNQYAVLLDRFKEQMQWLHDNGYQTVESTSKWLQAVAKGNTKEKIILITFDDGLRDILLVKPILDSFNFKATLFVYPTYIQAKKPKALTWKELQSLASVYDIQSHTLWHPMLNAMTPKEQSIQFSKSKKILEDHLKNTVYHLAYPFGNFTENSELLLRQDGYRSAFTILEGNNITGQDPFHLKRNMITSGDTLSSFKLKVEQRPFPIATQNPPIGSTLQDGQQITLTIPKKLSQEKITLKFFSKKLDFKYDPIRGNLQFKLEKTQKKTGLFYLRYMANNKTYLNSFLYHFKRN